MSDFEKHAQNLEFWRVINGGELDDLLESSQEVIENYDQFDAFRIKKEGDYRSWNSDGYDQSD